MTDAATQAQRGHRRFVSGPKAQHHCHHLDAQQPPRRDRLPVRHTPHERGHDPRTTQAAAGGRFIHALQASVFCGVVAYVKGVGGYSTAREMGKQT